MYIISHKEIDVMTGEKFNYVIPAQYSLTIRPHRSKEVWCYTEKDGFLIDDKIEKMYKVYSFEKEANANLKCVYFDSEKEMQKYIDDLSSRDIDYSAMKPNYLRESKEMHCIYVLANPLIMGALYISATNMNVWIQATDLYNTTGVPSPFVVVAIKEVNDYNEAALYLENALVSFKINPKKYFYNISLKEANKFIEEYKG